MRRLPPLRFRRSDNDLRFRFRLARDLGFQTVADLEDRMSGTEYIWWREFYIREHDEQIEQS
jgi:hypothetical protein